MKRILFIAAAAVAAISIFAATGCTKMQANDSIDIHSEVISFSAAGSLSVPVPFRASSGWTAGSSASWCTVAPTSGESGYNTILIACDKNTGGDRSTSVWITCGDLTTTISVTQSKPE